MKIEGSQKIGVILSKIRPVKLAIQSPTVHQHQGTHNQVEGACHSVLQKMN